MAIDLKGNVSSPMGNLVIRPSQWALLDEEQRNNFLTKGFILVPKGYAHAGAAVTRASFPEFFTVGDADFYAQAAADMQKPVATIQTEVAQTGISYAVGARPEPPPPPLPPKVEEKVVLGQELTENDILELIISIILYLLGYQQEAQVAQQQAVVRQQATAVEEISKAAKQPIGYAPSAHVW